MKKTLILAAISALTASTAFAQSSVTVYGRLNTSVERQKDLAVSGSQTVLQNNASRLGFKGTEDLGGGLRANFLLEHRFNSDTGTVTSDFWAGDSYVGLSGGFGAVRLGRLTSAAYFATADYISNHNHDTGTSEDKLYTYLSGNKNTLSYQTPSFGGANAEFTVSLPEGTGVLKQNQVTNVAVNYVGGPLHLGLGYEKQAKTEDSQLGLRAMFEIGNLTLGGYYQRSDSKQSQNRPAALGTRNAYRLSAMYTLGASEFHLNGGLAGDWSKLKNSKAKQYTLAYNYNLSKRTKVFAFYTTVDNGSAFSYFGATGTGGKVLDPSSFSVGVRHNF